jgi:[ribosomal protein S18]-alanine N-acetyltransferase
MRSPLDYFRKPTFAIESLKTSHAASISKLHGEGFNRPWSDGEFLALVGQAAVFGFVAKPEGRSSAAPSGFVLARLAAGEAEILTIVVSKSARRCGLGHSLMDTVLRHLHRARAEYLILEVDETNLAAIGLYKRFGFKEVARRPAYYDTKDGKTSALVMRLDLH